mmetsp:Transcript_20470/g.51030  ORF Transcript_20470/g.51030 Transcript_20470/m.51030 type:complete len:83 (-) Transcript_20470:196-444(-)
MCEQAGVPFLGRVPLDPAIAAAADQGRSLFPSTGETDAGGSLAEEDMMGTKSTSFVAVNAIVEGVLRALENNNKSQTAVVTE